jgi:purine-binding chemotaxis protein CheW
MDEIDNILKERARVLAQEPETSGVGEAALDVIEFLLGREHYAFESIHVGEVYSLKELTPVPCTPPFVLGIINLRGQILSVIDLKKFFALPEQAIERNKVIVVRTAEMELGILVDAVLGARSILTQDVQPLLSTAGDLRETYLRGVTRERLIILDAVKLLAEPKLIVSETV